MKIDLHPRSLLLGFAVAVLAFVTLGQKAPEKETKWEYQVVLDVDDDDVAELSKDGWSYVGYLGTGIQGTGSDETLWRRAD